MADKFLDNTGLQYLWGKLKAKFLNTADEGLPEVWVGKEFATYDGSNSDICGRDYPKSSGNSRNLAPLSVSPGFTGAGDILYVSILTQDSTDRQIATFTLSGNTIPMIYYILEGSNGLEISDNSSTISTPSHWYDNGLAVGFTQGTHAYVVQDPFFGMWWMTTTSGAITATDLDINFPIAEAEVGSRQIWYTDLGVTNHFDTDKPQDHFGFWECGGIVHVRGSVNYSWDDTNTQHVAYAFKGPRTRSIDIINTLSSGNYYFTWNGTTTSVDIGV